MNNRNTLKFLNLFQVLKLLVNGMQTRYANMFYCDLVYFFYL